MTFTFKGDVTMEWRVQNADLSAIPAGVLSQAAAQVGAGGAELALYLRAPADVHAWNAEHVAPALTQFAEQLRHAEDAGQALAEQRRLRAQLARGKEQLQAAQAALPEADARWDAALLADDGKAVEKAERERGKLRAEAECWQARCEKLGSALAQLAPAVELEKQAALNGVSRAWHERLSARRRELLDKILAAAGPDLDELLVVAEQLRAVGRAKVARDVPPNRLAEAADLAAAGVTSP
jgi:hypothetical protein